MSFSLVNVGTLEEIKAGLSNWGLTHAADVSYKSQMMVRLVPTATHTVTDTDSASLQGSTSNMVLPEIEEKLIQLSYKQHW